MKNGIKCNIWTFTSFVKWTFLPNFFSKPSQNIEIFNMIYNLLGLGANKMFDSSYVRQNEIRCTTGKFSKNRFSPYTWQVVPQTKALITLRNVASKALCKNNAPEESYGFQMRDFSYQVKL